MAPFSSHLPVSWASCFHHISFLSCLKLCDQASHHYGHTHGEVTLDQPCAWPHNNGRERFVTHPTDGKTEGRELRKQAQGVEPELKSGLWVSYTLCILTILSVLCLPSRWSLQSLAFTLQLLQQKYLILTQRTPPSFKRRQCIADYWFSNGKSSNHNIENS